MNAFVKALTNRFTILGLAIWATGFAISQLSDFLFGLALELVGVGVLFGHSIYLHFKAQKQWKKLMQGETRKENP